SRPSTTSSKRIMPACPSGTALRTTHGDVATGWIASSIVSPHRYVGNGAPGTTSARPPLLLAANHVAVPSHHGAIGSARAAVTRSRSIIGPTETTPATAALARTAR